MKRTMVAIVVCVTAFAVLAGVAAARRASTVKMTARLTAKQAASLQSVKALNASGRFAGTLLRYSNGRSRLTWSLRYRHMSSRVIRADLVIPATGTQGTVTVQLCRSCKANAHGVVAPILKSSTRALVTRPTWVVVYTKKNRQGEIRGRVIRGH